MYVYHLHTFCIGHCYLHHRWPFYWFSTKYYLFSLARCIAWMMSRVKHEGGAEERRRGRGGSKSACSCFASDENARGPATRRWWCCWWSDALDVFSDLGPIFSRINLRKRLKIRSTSYVQYICKEWDAHTRCMKPGIFWIASCRVIQSLFLCGFLITSIFIFLIFSDRR